MGALRAIRAIFRTAARLDAQQRAALYVRGVMMLAMNGLRAEEELGERKMIERLDALGRPIVTDVWHHAILIQTSCRLRNARLA